MQNCLTKAWMLGGRHSPGVHNVVAPSSGGLNAAAANAMWLSKAGEFAAFAYSCVTTD
jgi:hypothetical protein